MPIGTNKAPKNLPSRAKKLWVETFNGVIEECKGSTRECDEQAAKIAWDQVKSEYRKVGENWVLKAEYGEAYHDVLLNITKASLQPDGSVRWQAVASDTGMDRANEKTSVELFQDWIDRVTYKAKVDYLPSPRMPFLGVSHYPALDGYGEAGETRRMYIDGNVFKADGVFNPDSAIGEKLLDAVKTELAMIKKGEAVEKPIRISAGWWDIQHYHSDSDYLFTRQSLLDRCPLCEKGQTNDKIYKAGQLDHFAATRVPMNPRTSLGLEEKSMAKITRRDDAESIIGQEDADELERQARMVGKSDTAENELHPAMVVRGDLGRGGYMAGIRRKKKKDAAEVAKRMKISTDRLKRLEEDEEDMDDEAMATMAEALDMDDDEKEEMFAQFPKKKAGTKPDKEELLERFGDKRREKPPVRKAALKTVDGDEYPSGDFLVVEDPEKPTTWHLQVKRKGEIDRRLMGAAWAALHGGYRGNKYEGPMKDQALTKLKKLYKDEDAPLPTEKMDYEGDMPMMAPAPFGGAMSIKEAEDYIGNQEKMVQMYSFWDMLQGAFHNIKADMDMSSGDKVKATSNLFREMAQKVDTLKAGLSDAFLIQESAAAYDDYEDYDDYDADEIYYSEDDDEVNIMSNPADTLQAAVDAALQNKSLTREDQAQAIQNALNGYAETVKGELDKANPEPLENTIAQAIKGAVSDVMGPIAEKLALMDAKINQQGPVQQSGQVQLHEVYVPQQKSMIAPQSPPQPVVPTENGVPVSPVTGKPSTLTAKIRKSVGLHS